MGKLNRRNWLRFTAAGATAAWCVRLPASCLAASDKPGGCTLSIGTYSLMGVAVEDAIKLVAGIGYNGIEIAVQPDFGATPAEMPAQRCQKVRELLAQAGLKLTALMEHLPPSKGESGRRADLERIRRAMELAHALAPERPPLVQSVLGNGQWDQQKSLYRDRLGGWVDAAKESRVVLAVKPHRGSGMSRPEEAIWLIRQLGDTPWLRMVFDYSHYVFRDMPLEATVRTALPYTAHIAVKDAAERDGRVEFALAGEAGTIDYPRLLRMFFDGGYRGDVCCEVSSMVWKKPGYDPVAAATTCYRNMARAFEQSKVPRG